MYSQEMLRDRYQILFVWKLTQGLDGGYSLQLQHSKRRRTTILVPPITVNSPAAVRKAKEASLQVKGARLFNLMPKRLRDMKGVTVDTFKAGVDTWLLSIPDQPTIDCRELPSATL